MISYLDGNDAVFLPGKIHGAEHQIYIIYYNSDADNGNGCFEIEVLDCEKILELYEYVNGDAEKFFTLLPDWFQGEWYYCDRNSCDFNLYVSCYNNADFLLQKTAIDKELLFLFRNANILMQKIGIITD